MEPQDRQTQPEARSQHRAYVLDHVVAGSLTLDQAAKVLGLSTRQVNRLIARHADGPAALAHGNRGRPPANRIDDQLRRRVVELATTTYAGLNHTHLAELLAEREGLAIAARTLRRILAEASVRPTRTRRPARHRSRRERMPREGQLLQVDGSRHRWFGPDVGFATLVAGIDDATGRVPGGTFRAQEDAVGYFTTFAQTAERHGLPGAVYSDRHGIFIVEKNRAPTLAEQLTGKRSLTQVGRALDEARVGWIGAHSAEAKGRVERLWGTLQDRLVAELRLEGITTIEAANAFLPGFLERHNARFAVPAADPEPAWRPQIRRGLLLPLSTPGRPGQHGQLARRRSRAAAATRWSKLGGTVGHRPGAPRRQPVGQPRRPVRPSPTGAGRPGPAPGSQAHAAVGSRPAGRADGAARRRQVSGSGAAPRRRASAAP